MNMKEQGQVSHLPITTHRKREWNKMIDRAMAVDFSWNNSAKKYADLYRGL